jgi:hypothetical protein
MHITAIDLGRPRFGLTLPLRLGGLIAFAAAFYWYPLLTLLLVCVIAAASGSRIGGAIFLVAAALLFTIVNITKELAGDLANYVLVVQYLANRPFTTLFNAYEMAPLSGSYRVTEIGFHGTMWALSNIFDSGRVIVAVGATAGIYLPVFFGLRLIARREAWTQGEFLTVVFFVFFAAINFVQTTHLLRQYISTAVVFLAFALFVNGRNLWALFVTLVACSIHNGTALLVADLAALTVLFPRQRLARLGLISLGLRFVAALIVIGASVGLIFLQQLEHIGLPEGTITIWHYLLVVGFLGVSVLRDARNGTLSPTHYYARLAFTVIFVISLAFFVLDVRLLALRYFDYLECLFGLILANILCSMPRERVVLPLFTRWGVCFVSVMILVWRVFTAPWNYGPGELDTFMADLPTLAGMLVE